MLRRLSQIPRYCPMGLHEGSWQCSRHASTRRLSFMATSNNSSPNNPSKTSSDSISHIAPRRCLDLSPASPSPHIFKPIASVSGGDAELLTVPTGYGPQGLFAVVDPTAFSAILRDALGTRTLEEDGDVNGTTHHGSETSVDRGNHLTRELLRLERDTMAELAPMLKIHDDVHQAVWRRFYPALRYGCFVLLSTQLAVFSYWIFVIFDWNIVEPMTYFVGYTAVFCGLLFHYLRCGDTLGSLDEFSWDSAFVWMSQRRVKRLCEKRGVDMLKMETLQQRLREVQEELRKQAI